MAKVEKIKISPYIYACLDDKEENLLISVELPGVAKGKIDVKMYEELFSVSAEREDLEYVGHLHFADIYVEQPQNSQL